MIDLIAYLFGHLFSIFGPALVLAVLTSLPRIKE